MHTIVELKRKMLEKKELEKIILIKSQKKFTPKLRKLLFFCLKNQVTKK